ncbi:signal recognition particle receptor subunit alpha, partial [Methyloceanibacter marginalis]|uniref:signal recognition particle receptor subunit alpha n=1 Tax=Methyloceanibacter marginalis TaxID=1774971 RepID=UPI0018742224
MTAESKRASFFERLRRVTAADADEPEEEAGPTAPAPKKPHHKDEPSPKRPESTPPAPPPDAPEPNKKHERESDKQPEEEAGPMSPAPDKAKARRAGGWFAQLKSGLSRTSNALTENLAGVLTKRKLDAETLDELEEALIRADLGVAMAERIRGAIAGGRYETGLTEDDVRAVLAEEVA